jgi:tRNA(Ile)-lysidine synthase
MAGPHPAVAATRLAVRHAVSDLPAGAHVMVAGSGGPDSTALAAATAFVAPRLGLTAGFACADQHWSPQSTDLARAAVETATELGLAPSILVDAPAARTEGAARDARREALLAAAESQAASAVLLGHTLDDQAETVLLRLGRGSGARSLAGMAERDDPWRRPFLELRRDLVRASCLALNLPTWDDPANTDPSFARTRVRHQVLPLLEATLGPGITASLARSADLLRTDADGLDALAACYLADFANPFSSADGGPAEALATKSLAELPLAVRSRVLRAAALHAGCPPTALTAGHINALDGLVMTWRGQGPLSLPGGVSAARRDGTIILKQHQKHASATRRTPHSNELDPRHLTPESEADAAMTQLMAADQPPQVRREPDPAGSSPHPDIAEVLISREEIATKVAELAAAIDADYAGQSVLLVGVLKGAAMVMADLSRAMTVDTTLEFMAVSSYGSSTSSSGVVRILKDLDRSIEGIHVLVVEDIIDSGLTLSWLVRNLRSRSPASVEVVTLLRKPEALKVNVDVRYVGFDIPSAFVVGYGLDYAERYRTLPYVGTLTQEAIDRGK